MEELSRWTLMADMNQNGAITISDAWLWFQWFYFLPGDGLLYFFMEKLIPLGAFFELTVQSYGNLFAGVISFLFWAIAGLVTLSLAA
jgi:hypothetical protein